MRRLLSLITLSAIIPLGAAAQGEAQAPAANKQATLILGNNPMFNQSGEYYLASYGEDETGLDREPGYYLDLGEVGSNSLLNMVGVQFSYFITPEIEANAMFSMNISSTPKKDYEEGVEVAGNNFAPASRHIEGSLKSNWFANVGGNYHFALGQNQMISAYAGIRLGGMMSRIQTTIPYTGDDDEAIFYKSSRSGQAWGLQGAIMAGIDCRLRCGILLGLELAPAAYQYSVIEIDPEGLYHYQCDYHSIKLFSTPTLKLGFRF